jgi:hypothetical protein
MEVSKVTKLENGEAGIQVQLFSDPKAHTFNHQKTLRSSAEVHFKKPISLRI